MTLRPGLLPGRPQPVTDILSDVLRAVRLTGALFFTVDESSPYAAAAPRGEELAPAIFPGAQRIISYHVVREGGCWYSLNGDGPRRLEAGDVLVLPHGDAYSLTSPPEARPTLSLDENLELFRQLASRRLPPRVGGGGDGEPLRLICGFLACDVLPFNPALATLPRALVVRRPQHAGDRFAQLVDLVVAETSAPRAGSDCVLVRLGELLFVEVMRRHLESLPARGGGWIAGLRDPLVGRALTLLHDHPEEPWTLDRLAAGVAVSRSSLAERFTRRVGTPPMQYLTSWRIQLAARRLTDGREKIAAVAHTVGYASEAAFSRAFKRAVGVSPSAWRRGAAA